MMGNSAAILSSDQPKGQTTLRTVEAVNKFKMGIKSKKTRKSILSREDDSVIIEDQIRDILDSRFKRKSKVGGVDVLDCEVNTDDGDGSPDENEPLQAQQSSYLKYVKTSHVSQGYRQFSVTDTSVAWMALRDAMETSDRRKSSAPQNNLRKVSNVLRFLRPTEVKPVQEIVDVEQIVPYHSEETQEPWEFRCHFCNQMPRGGLQSRLNPCRLCAKVYHTECLKKRGHLTDELQNEAITLAQTDIGWSCPSCESLFWLLSDKEKVDLMETFDEVDANKDSCITREEFIQYKQREYKRLMSMEMPNYRQHLEMRIFNDMDRDGTGLIDWWEFMTPMCIIMLQKKKKCDLVRMLLPREIERVRRFFRAYDPHNSGNISIQDARRCFQQWYISLISREPNQIPLAEWMGVEEKDDGRIAIFTKRDVSWGEYLRRHVLSVLAARPNTASQQPYIPRLDTEDVESHNDHYD